MAVYSCPCSECARLIMSGLLFEMRRVHRIGHEGIGGELVLYVA